MTDDQQPAASSDPAAGVPDSQPLVWQPLGAAAILETQMGECVQVVRDLAEYARDPRVPGHERMIAISTIGHLLDHCAGVGKVVARLNGTETVHRSVVEKGR